MRRLVGSVLFLLAIRIYPGVVREIFEGVVKSITDDREGSRPPAPPPAPPGSTLPARPSR